VYEGADSILLHSWKWNRHHSDKLLDDVSLLTQTSINAAAALSDISGALANQLNVAGAQTDSANGISLRLA